jgi:hypothetical protein
MFALSAIHHGFEFVLEQAPLGPLAEHMERWSRANPTTPSPPLVCVAPHRNTVPNRSRFRNHARQCTRPAVFRNPRGCSLSSDCSRVWKVTDENRAPQFREEADLVRSATEIAKRIWMRFSARMTGDDRQLATMRSQCGYVSNIFLPRSFNEKVIKRKLSPAPALWSVLADKVRVREYVSSVVGPRS